MLAYFSKLPAERLDLSFLLRLITLTSTMHFFEAVSRTNKDIKVLVLFLSQILFPFPEFQLRNPYLLLLPLELFHYLALIGLSCLGRKAC